jgi:hypothetical protein
LAIIPGLLATVGLVRSDFSIWMLIGMILLAAFLISAALWNRKQLPDWSLMAAGMLASVGLTILSGVIGGLAAILVSRLANVIVLLVLLAALVVLLVISSRKQRISPLAWVLMAVIIVCQLAVRIKYFVLLGVSWQVTGEWLSISLYAAVIALLLPVVLGLRLAQRHGLLAILFVIGMIYGAFQLLIDVNDKVSSQLGITLAFFAYKGLIPLLFTVVAPLWFLRGRSLCSRTGGGLALVSLAVIINLIVVGISYGGKLPTIIWVSFIPYTLSVLSTLVLAYLLFQESGI